MEEGKEVPLVTLRYKKGMWRLAVFFVICIILLGISVVFPVLISGDYSDAWTHDAKRPMRSIIGFYLALFCLFSLPLYTGIFKVGKYDFYDDRIEVKPFWSQNNIVIPYKQMHVMLYGHDRVVIAIQNVPSWSRPIQRYRIQYLEGLTIAFSSHGYENPADVPKAVQILKEKAFVLSEKKSMKKSIYF